MKSFLSILFFFFSASISYGQNITTIAGNGVYGFGGDYGPGTAASLKHPRDVAVDDSGNVYIADTENGCVRKLDRYGVITTYAGVGEMGGYYGDGGPATMALTSGTHGIGVDVKGNLYIADYHNQRIRKVNSAGIITTIAGNGIAGYSGDNGPATAASLNYPFDVAADKWGNVFISDNLNQRIRKIDTFGIITTIAGTGVAGYSGDGIPATSSQINTALKISVDTFGNIYFISDNSVRKIDNTGIISTVAGTRVGGYSGDGTPATSAQISSEGLDVDNYGNIYLAEMSYCIIRKVSAGGIISTIAGNVAVGGGFAGDGGPAINGKLYVPSGVASDKFGNIYIADQGNDRIRKIYYHTEEVGNVNFEKQISVYPNPGHGDFTIVAPFGASNPLPVSIVDITGRVVGAYMVTPGKPLKVSLEVPGGVYFLLATTPKGVVKEQIVIIK